MTRSWPQPQCSTGCCYCEEYLEQWSYAFVSGCPQTAYRQSYNFRFVSNGYTSQSACQAQCEINLQLGEHFINNPASFCHGKIDFRRAVTGFWYNGNSCCYIDHSPVRRESPTACSYQTTTPPAISDDSYTFADYDRCASAHKNGNCNPGYCLPATQTDPVECYNLNTTCGNAVPGSSPVPFTPGDPNRPNYCLSRSDNRCGGIGCCLCDRLCDMNPTQCDLLGGQVMTGPASSPTVQAACNNANKKPVCRLARFQLGIRPFEHYPDAPGRIPAGPGRLEPISVARQRTNDRATFADECRVTYGWMEKSQQQPGCVEGKICNNYNRRTGTAPSGPQACNNAKTTARLRLVKTNFGYLQFEGAYRLPCPEQAEWGCSTRVCPT